MTTPINKILINQTQTLSNEELANVSASLSAILGQDGGGGGEPCASAWRPTVTDEGLLSWTLTTSTTTPTPVNIMGPSGTSGAKGDDGTSIILQSVTDVAGGKQVTLAWGETPSTSSFVIPSGDKGTDGQDGQDGAPGANGISPTFTITPTAGGTHVTISGAQGEDSFDVLSGAKGANGTNGFSPTVSTTTTASEDRTGTVLTFTYGDAGGQTISYTAWDGKDGTGASIDLFEGTGIQITHTGANYTIGVSADYFALKTDLPDVTDMATKTWVGEQGYLTSIPDTYATKTYANDASANALSEAKTWVEEQSYLPTSGGTVSGQLTISGSNFDNNLHLKRGNNEGFIGLAGNGAITLKGNVNGSTSQIEFLTSDSKTFDITVKDNSTTPLPTGKLYVMSAHSFADASATSANWANDGMLHIILDS